MALGHNLPGRPTCDLAVKLIKAFEGYSSTIYICAGGYETIGWGHLVRKAERASFLKGIDKGEADFLLRYDLKASEESVERWIAAPLTDNQHGALVSFTFNLGGGALQSSTLRSVLNEGDYEEAANQFHRWVFAGGRKLNGLIRRRRAESNLFLLGGIDSRIDPPQSRPLTRPGANLFSRNR